MLSICTVQEYPRTKRGHWSDGEPFGLWPAYDNYDDVKEVMPLINLNNLRVDVNRWVEIECLDNLCCTQP